MARWSWGYVVAAVVLALAVDVGLRVTRLLGAGVELAYNDAGCVLVGADVLVGSEDLAHAGDGVVLVSSGDLYNTFHGDPAAPGAIFAVDLKPATPTVRRLPVAGMPADGPLFQPHGIYFSNATQRLYAVSHSQPTGRGSRIVIFAVGPDLALTYVRSVVAPLLRNGVPNDVVEGATAGELYVTEYLQAEQPLHGTHHPEGLRDKLQLALTPLLMLAWPGSRVFRCTFTDDDAVPAACNVAATGFYMANGITRDPATGHVFVNELIGKTIRTLRPTADGRLEDAAPPLPVEFAGDNLEWDAASASLHIGTIPFPFMSEERVLPVPGGLGIATRATDGSGTFASSDMRVLVHDGTKLSQISAAIRWGARTVLGSPFSAGVLVC